MAEISAEFQGLILQGHIQTKRVTIIRDKNSIESKTYWSKDIEYNNHYASFKKIVYLYIYIYVYIYIYKI